MARSTGTFNFAANFEVLSKAPLDARMVVNNYTDLILPNTWQDGNNNIWLFDGAIVSVANDPSGGIYYLADADNYDDYASWIPSGIGGQDSSVKGGINIGDGSANVFAGIDASGNIQFRTISGSGAALVSQIGDQIIVSIDASFGGEVNTASNIGAGDASIFSQKLGQNLEFRSLKGSQNILIDVSDNIVTIDTSGNINDIYSLLDQKLDVSGGTITGNLEIDGSLIVNGPAYFSNNVYIDGSLFVTNVSTIDVSGAFITLNTGQIGSPLPDMQSGIVIDRGTEPPYVFIFDEDTETFRIGIAVPDSSMSFDDASTQAVATREDNPIDKAISVWNDAMARFDTSAALLFNETGLFVDSSVKISTLAGAGVRFVTALSDGTLDVSTLPNYVREASLGDSFSFDSSGFLKVDVSSAGNYNTTLDPSLTMLSAVGGYPAGTSVADLFGDSLIAMWDNLLFPTVAPIINAPSQTFTINPTTSYYEISSIINLTFTGGLGKGSIYNGVTFQNFRSGDASLYNYTDPSSNTLLVDTPTSSLSNVQNINGYKVLIGSQSFTCQVSYLEGPQPLDNKGNPSGSPLSAGTFPGTISRSFEGVYPLFGTTSDIVTPTKQPLVSMLSGNNIVFNMVPETGGNKQFFEIPDTWVTSPTNRALTGIETYNTVSSSWEYEGGTAGASLTKWTITNTTHTIQSVPGIGYKKYTYNGTDRSSIQIRLKF
ncbi:MAG: hypothetical protein HC831_11705 [Chloroflexia bacterium]|nr:hypothetical protein [Chloroflexia bacterium]